MISLDKYIGCFMGLAIGDATGAPFEGGPLERLLWKALSINSKGKLRYSDDTQMALDLAHSFVHNQSIQQEHLAQTFAKSYHWSRGYGPSAAVLLKNIRQGAKWQDVNRRKYKEGSLGNGAGMRAPIIALCCPRDEGSLRQLVIQCSEITHAHPQAIEGAQLVAWVTRMALMDTSLEEICDSLLVQCVLDIYKEKVLCALEFLKTPGQITTRTIRQKLGHGMIATESCVTAIFFALGYATHPMEQMLKQIRQLGGDVDTIGAMAGGIWGAFNGYQTLKAPGDKVEKSEVIIKLAEQLYSQVFPPASEARFSSEN